ncbi:uncharacterized protein [Macrobrachium rosenbergii]|uniref:uncharacterized protein isoform X2 n=1 Tax=Macrobrachium rosenbergii TaxID=79674 RepID=UPI0034D64548
MKKFPRCVYRMERLMLTFLLGVFLLAAADATVSSIRTIYEGDSTTFSLPKNEKYVVLAVKSAEAPKITYQCNAPGRVLKRGTCNECYREPHWFAFLTVTEKWIHSVGSDISWFPENVGSSQARYLSVKSRGSSPVDLQLFTLPLKDHEVMTVPGGRSADLTLPDKPEVWVALTNYQETEVSYTASLYHGTKLTEKIHQEEPEIGWSVFWIYEDDTFDGANYDPLSESGLTGRRLEMHSDNSLKYQVFPMPLEPTSPVQM